MPSAPEPPRAPSTTKTARGESTTESRATFHLGYRPELDGLRALAVSLVFFAHIGFPWPSLDKSFMPGAFQGVDLFFVLSGFLLTALLLEERELTGRFSFAGFYRRRALRLLPALFFLLVCLLPFFIQQRIFSSAVVEAYGYMIFYVTNWAMVIQSPEVMPYHFGHMWSLAIEEQYYLIFFPLLVLVVHWCKSLKGVAWFLFALIVVVWINRIVAASHTSPGDFEATLYLRTDIRADALLWGPLLAVLLHLGWRITPKVRLLAIPAACFLIWSIAYVHVNERSTYTWSLGVIDFCWTIVLMAVLGARHPFARFLRLRPVVWIGTISYGLYLWHLPVFVEMFRHTRYRPFLPNWLPFVLAILLSFLCATVSYYLVERPFLRRKRPRGTVTTPSP